MLEFWGLSPPQVKQHRCVTEKGGEKTRYLNINHLNWCFCAKQMASKTFKISQNKCAKKSFIKFSDGLHILIVDEASSWDNQAVSRADRREEGMLSRTSRAVTGTHKRTPSENTPSRSSTPCLFQSVEHNCRVKVHSV